MGSKSNTDQDKIGSVPKFICNSSMFMSIGSGIAACSSGLLGASFDVLSGFQVFSGISLGIMFVSALFYVDQIKKEVQISKRLGGGCQLKEGKSSKLVAGTSVSVLMSSIAAGAGAASLGSSLKVVCGIMMLSYISLLGIAVPFARLGEAAVNKDERSSSDSLDESRQREGYSFLKQLNLLGKLRNRNESKEYRVLQEFNADEEYPLVPYKERRSLIKNSSGPSYGSGLTTSML